MSLEWGRFRMLGIDRQHAGKRKIKPGANPGVSGGQRWRAVRSREPGAAVWLGRSNPEGARLRPPDTPEQRAGTALPGKDNRNEPGATDPSDRRVSGGWCGEGADLPAQTISDTLHNRRC